MVSATTYTLVGVVNKFFTVLLNVIIWDKHSTPFGKWDAVCCIAELCCMCEVKSLVGILNMGVDSVL